MTKNEALKALEEGKKITHKYFSNDEYICKCDSEFYMCESGYMPIGDFWNYRQSPDWDNDWSIFNG